MLKGGFLRKCNWLIRPNYWLKLKKPKSDQMPRDEEDWDQYSDYNSYYMKLLLIYYNQTIPKIIAQIFTFSNIRETFTQLSFWEREEMKKIELNKMRFKTEKVNWYWVN